MTDTGQLDEATEADLLRASHASSAAFRVLYDRHAPAPEVSDFSGTKEVLAIDGVAAGGCIGLDTAGMTWDCYIGLDAVDHEIISQDFLGEPILGPGRG